MSAPLLVDTHFILWLRIVPQTLTRGERAALDDARTRWVSAVSLWEIAILVERGRIPQDERLMEVPSGFDLLAVTTDHCKALARLPRFHRDPFDRMLVAQAQSERAALLTRDREIEAYREQAPILRFPNG